jgi:hypothetical protein
MKLQDQTGELELMPSQGSRQAAHVAIQHVGAHPLERSHAQPRRARDGAPRGHRTVIHSDDDGLRPCIF